MHIILGMLFGLFGLAAGEGFGAVLGGAIGVLAAEALAQRRRIAALERVSQLQSSLPTDELDFTLVADEDEPEGVAHAQATIREVPEAQGSVVGGSRASRPAPGAYEATGHRGTPLDGFFTGLGDGLTKVAALLTRFFTGGNLVLKIGVIILFFGVAFLLKYAAQRNLVPLEFRLIGVALGGLVLLSLGWGLRRRILGYGLILQGGGIGILYLVVYAAAKLYHFLPLPLCLAVMIALVVLSSFLAVLQDAKSLAVAGIIGGFLAPVLMSTGGGSHVLLFSYYGLLNMGILGIAWFKSWRELNLLGFFFTFAIATFWGYSAYQPENFSTTEPCLIFFFLLYAAVSVLFAHRQPINLKGFIDGPLVFGLPLVVSGLQYCLVRDFEYGMALSALALGLFYALLAIVLWRRLAEGMRMLPEAFLALGVVFGSLAIPLALDGQWTSAIWALEGAAMIWVGVRQGRLLARLFALLLQIGAAVTFLDAAWYPFGALAFFNRFFLGGLLISFAALFSSYYLERFRAGLRKWEQYFPVPLLIWGLIWWYGAGLREVNRQFPGDEFANVLLLFFSASTMLMTMVGRRIDWRQLIIAQLTFLPAIILTVPLCLLHKVGGGHLLAGWGVAAWPLAIYTGYRLLSQVEDEWPPRFTRIWHPATLWLLLFVLCHEAAWQARQFIGPAETWQAICWGLLPAAAVFSLVHWGTRLRWPVAQYHADYLGTGCIVIGIMLIFWHLWCLTLAGDPAPIAYLPLINPLELSQIFVLVVLFFWGKDMANGQWRLPTALSPSLVYALLGGLTFLLLNGVVARTVHVFGGIPYSSWDLYHSVIFQSALAALWGMMALVITVWAAKNGNRRIWCVGALLLAMVVVKLFVIDLSGTGTVARIVSFLVVGILMLIVGYFSPLPPKKEDA